MNLQGIINFVLRNPEILIVGLVILSTVFSFLSNASKSMQEAQRRVTEEAERRRRGLMQESLEREKNPNSQSYESYLERTSTPDSTLNRPPPETGKSLRDFQSDIFEALGVPTNSSTSSNPQDDLRRKLAEKMGRTAPPPLVNQQRPRSQNNRREVAQSPSAFETYLDKTRTEANDSRPDAFGHSRRQPHFDLPTKIDRPEGTAAIQTKPEGVATVLEVRGKSIETGQISNNSPRVGGLVNASDAVKGLIWAEILERPRAGRRR
jgi:type II secretory pathway pseudopilin PulG